MFLNIKISKALPEKALRYAIGKNILCTTEKRNLLSNNPAKEMKETAFRYGKWTTTKERKTFSLIISPNPSDNPTEEQIIEITKAVLDAFFKNIQGILVLHKDKGKDAVKSKPILHAHFYGSVIDPITGKNLHLSDSNIRQIRAWADKYAERSFGWKPFCRGEQNAGRNYKKEMMHAISKSRHYSWMADLKKIIENAFSSAVSFDDFCMLLKNKGVEVQPKNDGSNEIQFCLSIGNRSVKVNAISISKELSINMLSEKFIELRRSNNDRQQRTNQTQVVTKMGGNSSLKDTTRTGTLDREGFVRQQRINYGCIFCTKDKSICRKCSEFKPKRGEKSHGCRTR